VPLSPFWAELAHFFLSGADKEFISKSFMYFKSSVEFILLAAFVPISESNEYDLSNDQDHLKLVVKAPLLLYVKEIKRVPFASKYGVLMNQRFYDPNNRYSYEDDGTQV
jgi:hypothetical protein